MGSRRQERIKAYCRLLRSYFAKLLKFSYTTRVVRYLAKICFCLILCSPSFSQQAKQYSFTHFTSANGLASNFVNRIAQDPFGYIWIATINGLQRYDGKRFLSFRNEKDNPGLIPTPEVVDIRFDRHGLLWVFTRDNKVGTFDYRKFIYTEYPVRIHRTLKNYVTKKTYRASRWRPGIIC